ncbi:MAG: peptidoglycan DD-metalloendopeptidase family protein [Desulfamplus sp.]|nr:peptidoglycan DD-metalloendopeptidase family protein [Desulfamplus sp.]
MKPSFKALNPPSNDHKIITISHKIFTILFVTLFLCFSITAIPLESASASVKKNSSVNKLKSNKSIVKNRSKADKSTTKNSRNKSKSDKCVTKNGKNKSKNDKIVTKNSRAKSKNNRNLAKSNKTKLKFNTGVVSKNNSSRSKKIAASQKDDINASVRIRQVSGVVKSSLHKTAVKMGLNKKLTNQLISIFRNTSALPNIRKGDLVQVAYQEKHVNGKRVKTGVITAAIITSKNKSYHAYRFAYNGKHGYYDENGNSLESSFLKVPLKYREISSGFSGRRLHPIKHIFQPHNGIDYSAPKGTPIKSVGDGIVIFKGYEYSAGNYIKIKHASTGISEYMHLSKFHKSMTVNTKVSKGDVIGYVGDTGYATGPHLHLGFIVNNRYVDYSKLKLPHGEPLPKQFRNMFFQHVAMINKQWNRTARRELSFNNTNTVVAPVL